MLRIAICEDVLQELERQKQIVESVMSKLYTNTELYCFRSGEDLLCEIDATGSMDMILLDIEMQGINGIETARRIRQMDARTVLIFISNYDQYCKALIEVQPFAFIDKPVSEKQLDRIIQYALETRFSLNESYSFSYHKMQYNIPLSEIRYFQSDKRIIHVSTSRKNSLAAEYQFYGKLEKVEEDVNKTNVKFIRIRKSFLVNPQFIVEYAANKVALDNGMIVEISKNYKAAVRQYYIAMLRRR